MRRGTRLRPYVFSFAGVGPWEDELAKLDALGATWFVAGPICAMLGFDFLSVRAVVVIVLDVSMIVRVFG